MESGVWRKDQERTVRFLYGRTSLNFSHHHSSSIFWCLFSFFRCADTVRSDPIGLYAYTGPHSASLIEAISYLHQAIDFT